MKASKWFWTPHLILKSIGKKCKKNINSPLLWDARKFEKLNNFKQSVAALVGGTFPYCFQQKWILFAICTIICIFMINSLLLVEQSKKTIICMAQNWFAFGNICQTALLFFGDSLWCRSVCICYFVTSSMSPHVGSRQNNCGASSQADFIQNYFFQKCMFRKQNFRKNKVFFIFTSSNPRCQNITINATLSTSDRQNLSFYYDVISFKLKHLPGKWYTLNL